MHNSIKLYNINSIQEIGPEQFLKTQKKEKKKLHEQVSQIPALDLLLLFFFPISSYLWPLIKINKTENNRNLICEYICTFCCHQSEMNDFFPKAPLRGSAKDTGEEKLSLKIDLWVVHLFVQSMERKKTFYAERLNQKFIINSQCFVQVTSGSKNKTNKKTPNIGTGCKKFGRKMCKCMTWSAKISMLNINAYQRAFPAKKACSYQIYQMDDQCQNYLFSISPS